MHISSAYVLWADGKYLKLKLHLNDFWDSAYSRASFFALFGGKKYYLPLCSKIWLHLLPKGHILRHTALISGETLVITSPLYSGVKMNFVWESKFCRESLMKQGLKTRQSSEQEGFGSVAYHSSGSWPTKPKKGGLTISFLYRQPLRDAENLRAPSCRNVLPRAMMSVYRDT